MNNKTSNPYLDCLLDSINQKRIVSIREFSKTDLYKNFDASSINEWYERIMKFVRKNPPSLYVKKMIVKQSEEKIVSINYLYTEILDKSIQFVISIEDIDNNWLVDYLGTFIFAFKYFLKKYGTNIRIIIIKFV